MAKTRIKETDLYPPLKAWLEAAGYAVYGEVGNCDVAAKRGDELVLIELKTAINLDLIRQIVKRQEADASVYAAVPAPPRRDRRWRELERLLKRLEAGLVLVHTGGLADRVEVAFHPIEQKRTKRKHVTRSILKEIAGRSADLNTGGCVRQKLATRYREEAIAVACILNAAGPQAPVAVKQRGGPAKAGAILYSNHYGWFERLGIGLYGLTDQGRKGLRDYSELAALILPKLDLASDTAATAGNAGAGRAGGKSA